MNIETVFNSRYDVSRKIILDYVAAMPKLASDDRLVIRQCIEDGYRLDKASARLVGKLYKASLQSRLVEG